METTLKAGEGVSILALLYKVSWNYIFNLSASQPSSKLSYLCSVEETSTGPAIMILLKTAHCGSKVWTLTCTHIHVHTRWTHTPPTMLANDRWLYHCSDKRTTSRCNQPWSPNIITTVCVCVCVCVYLCSYLCEVFFSIFWPVLNFDRPKATYLMMSLYSTL